MPDQLQKRQQQTIEKPISFAGIGIHTGQEVKMRFMPAPENFGIAFKRTDLKSQPLIPATLDYVCDTTRSTTLGIDGACVHTVEHVLAAVRAMEIDNLLIEVSNLEPPIGRGSSDLFVEMIEEAAIKQQAAHIFSKSLEETIYYSDAETTIIAIPSDTFRISYTLNYPNHKALEAQFYSFELTSQGFKKEIAPCRTFSLYEEIAPLIEYGKIKGGSLYNAVIIKDDAIISNEGLFFPNEMVRHKILDMIGDLSLVSTPFNAHVIAIRAGHTANFMFAKKLLKSISAEAPK